MTRSAPAASVDVTAQAPGASTLTMRLMREGSPDPAIMT